MLEHAALDWRGVAALDLHQGQHVLPDARRRQHGVGAQLAQVTLHRLGVLRTVGGHPRHQRHAQREGGVADPGHRQVRQPVVADLGVVHFHERFGRGDHVAMAQHHPLGTTRGARGVGDHRRVIGAAFGELGFVEIRIGLAELAALFQHALEGAQDRIVVE